MGRSGRPDRAQCKAAWRRQEIAHGPHHALPDTNRKLLILLNFLQGIRLWESPLRDRGAMANKNEPRRQQAHRERIIFDA